MLSILVLLLALIFAGLAAARIPEPPRLHYLSVALALVALAMLLPALGARW